MADRLKNKMIFCCVFFAQSSTKWLPQNTVFEILANIHVFKKSAQKQRHLCQKQNF